MEGIAVVRFRGDCDLYSAPRLKAEVLDKVAQGVERVIVDASMIDYLDSSGVGAIISILQAAKRSASDIRFLGLRTGPRRVLERTGILALMKEYPPFHGEPVQVS
jgi:anti-sigma B factor antagonist